MRDLFNPKPTNRFKGKGFTYIILTLASSFIFACIYFIVQKIQNPKETSKKDDDERINQTKIEPYENINKQEVFYIIDGNLSFFGCLLFSLVTQTTVGYGWFAHTDDITRTIVFLQLLSVIFIMGYVLN